MFKYKCPSQNVFCVWGKRQLLLVGCQELSIVCTCQLIPTYVFQSLFQCYTSVSPTLCACVSNKTVLFQVMGLAVTTPQLVVSYYYTIAIIPETISSSNARHCPYSLHLPPRQPSRVSSRDLPRPFPAVTPDLDPSHYVIV